MRARSNSRRARPVSGTETERRRQARRRGAWGEGVAALVLRCKGYKIIAQHYVVRGGEIDIIARRGTTLAFVEVKWRPTLADAMEAITPQKRRRIARAAHVFLAGRDVAMRLTLRGDAIYLAPWRWPRHVAGAFALELD